MADHPSVFELDVYQASTAAERAHAASLEEHLAACPRCRAHVDELSGGGRLPEVLAARLGAFYTHKDAGSAVETAPASSAAPALAAPPAASPFDASAPPSAPPHKVYDLHGKPRRRGPAPAFYRAASVAGALGLAAALAFYVTGGGPRTSAIPAAPDDESSYVGVKGVPAAQALIRREGVVRVWDGASKVRPGDALAVGVACDPFKRAAVFARGSGGPTKLWEGECPRGPHPTLPFTMLVDAEPGRERFTVVLSREALDDERSARALQASTRGADLWTIDFTFEKETR